jgi:two-component system, OmpR family, KDP operon response regulator KdpE
VQFRSARAGAFRRRLCVRAAPSVADAPWLTAFDVERVPVDAMGTGEPADVYLIDANARGALSVVARLVARSLPVLVIGDQHPATVELYLEAGAADYLTSRFTAEECAARVRASARWSASPTGAPDEVQIGDVSISIENYQVSRRGEPVRLTRNEFRLLALLLDRADANVPYRDIIRHFWDEEPRSARHYVRAYVRQLREKLEDDPDQPTLIVTEWGVGYRLVRTGAGRRSATA